jgi:glycosyltransferase involved in cell wall biosynthesis
VSVQAAAADAGVVGTAPVVSVVVPAHNEEAVIGRSLRRLLAGTDPGEFDVVVVANACADRTAALARDAGARVVETPVPGKPHALRLGDAACRTFPRIYLDADVELDAGSVRALVVACGLPGVLACAPLPQLDLTGVGWLTRRVHHVHDRLVAPTRALAGVGVYVLTEHGHARVFPLPDVISDDGFVHATFTPDERVVVADARSLVRPARTIPAYLNRRVRVRRGNRELVELGKFAPDGRLKLNALAGLVRGGTVSPFDGGCYLAVLLLDRGLTRLRRSRPNGWGSDASSRLPGATGS